MRARTRCIMARLSTQMLDLWTGDFDRIGGLSCQRVRAHNVPLPLTLTICNSLTSAKSPPKAQCAEPLRLYILDETLERFLIINHTINAPSSKNDAATMNLLATRTETKIGRTFNTSLSCIFLADRTQNIVRIVKRVQRGVTPNEERRRA